MVMISVNIKMPRMPKESSMKYFGNICEYFVNNELRIFLVGIKVNQSRLPISFGQKMFVVN